MLKDEPCSGNQVVRANALQTETVFLVKLTVFLREHRTRKKRHFGLNFLKRYNFLLLLFLACIHIIKTICNNFKVYPQIFGCHEYVDNHNENTIF